MKAGKLVTPIAVGLLVGVAVWWAVQGRHHGMGWFGHRGAGMHAQSGSRTMPTSSAEGIVIPAFSSAARKGEELFSVNCATCHGDKATGGDGGPPLIHPIYEPGHHGDASFLMAVRNGVRPHHWRFGPMPKIEGLSDTDVTEIVAYVRELQRANGIR